MRKIKVAVVDDSAFMRRIISDILSTSNEVEVVAKFRNGRELIDNYFKFEPDIITLDVEMPIMDGLETLKEIKQKKIPCTTIMLSCLTSTNSIHTLECLELGATDFVEKPSFKMLNNGESFKNMLVEKIVNIHRYKNRNMKVNSCECKEVCTKYSKKNIRAVVIGASTGGPRALQEVLTNIDKDIGVPIFVVQHMPKGFTKAFAERLNSLCKLEVVEAQDGMIIEKNKVYIAQGGFHMTVLNDRIKLNEEDAIWGVRPAVDKLFESAVKVYGGNIVSVVLTGMGKDGAYGTKLIKEQGGITISEDESTCTIYGMPRAAYETGKVDMVLELPRISDKINRLVKGS